MPIPVPPAAPPGLYVTSMSIIQGAMRLIGVLASGENPSAAEGSDALIILNQMIDVWQADRLKLYAEIRQVFPLTSGQQTYTMGIDPSGNTTANFSVARPARIDKLSVLQINSTPQPIELPLDYITYQQWADIPVKNVQSALPQQVWDDQQFPFRNLNFWPIPNTSVDVAIYSWSAISQFADLGSTQYAFPPAYLLAIRYSLAEFLAPEYGASGNPQMAMVVQKAQELREVIEVMNAPTIDLRVDPALMNEDQGLYNYYSDTPVRR